MEVQAMPEDANEAPESGAAAEPSKPPPKRSRRTLVVLALVVLLGGGAGAAWYRGMLPLPGLGGGGHGEADGAVSGHGAHDEGHGGGHGGEHGGEHGLGPMLPLDPFIANLADEGGKRYLKATFQIEFLGAAVPPGTDARLPQIRDLLLTLLTSKTFDDIKTPEGKQELRDEIATRVNQTLDRDAVKAVYFTEFIVQ
jgi:flagellar FliL protein